MDSADGLINLTLKDVSRITIPVFSSRRRDLSNLPASCNRRQASVN